MTQTALDAAHAAMQATGDNDTTRLRFYERLADSELFLLLEHAAEGDNISPMVFPVEGTSVVLAFDRADRLTAFTGKPAPYVAMSGRILAGMLAAEGLGLGVNLDVAPSSILIPADGVQWLNDTLGNGPAQVDAKPQELHAPTGLPEDLITALDRKLALATGLARYAYLVSVTYADRGQGHMLAFIDPVDGAEHALAQAANEALVFSGLAAGQMDVAFFSASDPMAAKLAKVGLRFDLPQQTEHQALGPVAPGGDPDKPPILK